MKTVHACLVYIVLGILDIYCLTFHWMLLWLQILLDISLDAIMATYIAWHFIGCYFGYRYCLAFHWMLFWVYSYCLAFLWLLFWLQVLLGISLDVILVTGIAWHFIGCYFGTNVDCMLF